MYNTVKMRYAKKLSWTPNCGINTVFCMQLCDESLALVSQSDAYWVLSLISYDK